MTYFEKLQTVEWQRKKSEILFRDNFVCTICGTESKLLDVHHMWYTKGLEPWEEDNECYISLCRKCHEYVHNEGTKITKLITLAALKKGKPYIDIYKCLEDGGII